LAAADSMAATQRASNLGTAITPGSTCLDCFATVTATTVPEPTNYSMMMTGLVAIPVCRRLRRN